MLSEKLEVIPTTYQVQVRINPLMQYCSTYEWKNEVSQSGNENAVHGQGVAAMLKMRTLLMGNLQLSYSEYGIYYIWTIFICHIHEGIKPIY